MKYYESLVFNTYGDYPRTRNISRDGTFQGYYGIQYNHSGPVFLSVNHRPVCTHDGPCAFFTYPGPNFHYGVPEGQTRHHCFVCFSGSLVKRFISGGLMDLHRNPPLIPVVHSEKFYSSFQKLLTLIQNSGGHIPPRAAWLLEDLLLQLQEQPLTRFHVSPYCEHHLQRLRSEIVRDPARDWDFSAEATKLSISIPHFRRLFREIIGTSPRQFLIENRLDLATRLLENEVLSIAEIAHRAGFPDEYYFSRLFRQHRLVTPSAIRGLKGTNSR